MRAASFVLVMVAWGVGCGTSAPSDADVTLPRAAGASDASEIGNDEVASTDTGTVDVAPEPTPAPPPDVVPGVPITAKDGAWTNIPFPDGYCRNGAQAHMMVHLNSASKKVAIYEEGGGACFNDTSCKLLTFDPPSYLLGGGIFDFSNPDNPIRDWNVFYIPYCTGDVHAGDNPDGNPGPLTGKTHYSGYTNLKLYLARILATVPDATDMFLTGSSAGGFGAGLTADLVARNLPASVERFTLLDDSGPPMPSKYVKPCLQAQWNTVWGLGNSVLKDCGSACSDPNDFMLSFIRFLADKYGKGANAKRFMGGLISSTGDGVMSNFFGFGADDCKAAVPVALTSAQYLTGLFEVRSRIAAETDRFGTFYIDGTAHTTLIMNRGSGVLGGLYDTTVGGVKLTDWIRDLLDHRAAVHVGP